MLPPLEGLNDAPEATTSRVLLLKAPTIRPKRTIGNKDFFMNSSFKSKNCGRIRVLSKNMGPMFSLLFYFFLGSPK
jgi:hypothetical protein